MNDWLLLFCQKDYDRINNLCKKVIELEEKSNIHYCYFGLSLLLQEKEEEAKSIWAKGLSNCGEKELFYLKFYEILKEEAQRQEELKEYLTAYKIRDNIRRLLPKDFDNLVQMSYLSLNLQTFTSETIQDLGLVNLIRSSSDINDDSLFQLMQNIAYSPISQEESFGFISFCLPYVRDKKTCVDHLIYIATKSELDLALKYIDICLQLCPNSIKVLGCMVQLYIHNHHHSEAIKAAQNIVLRFPQNLDRVISNHLLLGALMSAGGNWKEVEVIFNQHRASLTQVVEQNLTNIPKLYLGYLCLGSFFAPYIHDDPSSNRRLQNQVMGLFQSNIQLSKSELTQKFQASHISRKEKIKHKKLRIGYLANSLRKHSVGWLARSMFQYFDRESFEIYGYFPEYKMGKDFLQEWYIGQMHKVYREGVDYWGNQFTVAEQIDLDEIDILVDLESLTSGLCCDILALKPAPLQVTWLGWDASGLPSIDYYIADPYVLPENAQDYYSEKIWRLPNTYIAVDGFETTISTLRRCDLSIPSDAIVYFSSQKSYKRHPNIVRSQIQIIKQVPNSYFLIKGLSDENSVQQFFYEIADSEGVERNRLKFLPYAIAEAEHRANMAIADVVLDTYPYNGATTTMETLWMGIPMVTQVGEQFVARNSYAMMINAGITEGIAWNTAEYVEWGVRFGTEESLRKEVAWKLRKSRKTSPLWDGRQFAREMENAYGQMWDTYNG